MLQSTTENCKYMESHLGRGSNNQNGTNFQTFFYPTFFLLQLNPTYMKRILHLVSVKNITFKSSKWLKIHILRLLQLLTANIRNSQLRESFLGYFKCTDTEMKNHFITIKPSSSNVFWQTIYLDKWYNDIMYLFYPQISPSMPQKSLFMQISCC